MLSLYTDQVFSIGIVNATLQPVVSASTAAQHARDGLYGFDPTCYLGVYMPDTFWLGKERPERAALHPLAHRRDGADAADHLGAGLHHHRAAAGRLFRELHRRTAGAQGEGVDQEQIDVLRQEYGFDQPPVLRYFHWVGGMLQGDFGYSFEYQLPVSDVVGDRLWLTVLVSFVTIIFTWLIAFPIGMYSATHQYSWGDYGLTFLGLLGIAIPNFMLALILMYFANIWFGTSIGHLMDPNISTSR